MLPPVFRIGMIADVEPGPAVEPAPLYAADIIRRQVITKLVTLVCAHPQFVRSGPKHDPYRISNSPCENLPISSVWVQFENARTILLARVVGVVGVGADGNI